MKIPAHTKKLADTYFADQNKRLGEIERGPRAERDGGKLLRKMADKDLYNQALDIVINTKLAPWLEWAKEDSEAKRTLKDNPLWVKKHEANHAEMQARIAKDREDGLTIEAAIAREGLKQLEETGVWVKPRSLEDIYAVLKGEK